jgi:hypothetical protein
MTVFAFNNEALAMFVLKGFFVAAL